jgi:uncharacterized protein
MQRSISHPAFAFALYGAVLTLWVLRLVLFNPLQNQPIQPWSQLFGIALKLAFFVVPALAFVPRSSVQRPARGLVIGFGLGLAYFGVSLLFRALTGNPRIDASALTGWWSQALGAAVPEELLFRGALLPLLARHHPFWRANLIASVMFLGIHVPGWISFGRSLEAIGQNAIGVMVVGLVTGWLWRRTGTLWAGMAFHLCWNLSFELLAP